MRKVLAAFIILQLPPYYYTKQNASVDELVNKTDSGWPLVQQWISSAKNKIEILSRDSIRQ